MIRAAVSLRPADLGAQLLAQVALAKRGDLHAAQSNAPVLLLVPRFAPNKNGKQRSDDRACDACAHRNLMTADQDLDVHR